MPKILKIEKKSSKRMVDLEVENIPSFFANGVVVHNSTKEIGEAMVAKGMDTGKRTETGRMKLDAKSIEEMDHPIIKKVTERNSLMKQLNTYAVKFTSTPTGYISYQYFKTATGRLASGNEAGKSGVKNDYFLSMNFQNLTKADSAIYEAIESDSPKSILGYEFILRDKEYKEQNPDKKYVKGQDQTMNIRSAVSTPDDSWMFLSVDYSSEEIILAGIMSGEPNYIEPYRNGEDVHKRTAIAVWGAENYDEGKRDLAKKLNFGLQYGGGVYLMVNGMGIDPTIADDTYNAFWRGLSTLKKYQDRTIKNAYNNLGTAYTYFGRPRRFKDKLFSDLFKIQKKGEREILNHPIQGTAGDIIRICLVKFYETWFSKPETFDEFRFVGTVHDEMCFVVKKDLFYKWMPRILDIMQIEFKQHDVRLKCELEAGPSFGETVVFLPDEKGIYKPKFM